MDNKITDEMLYESLKNINNQMVKSIPNEDELTYKFSNEFEEKMNDLLLGKNKFKLIYKGTQRVAVIAIVITLSMLTLTMSVEAIRTRVINVTKEIFESFTTYMFLTEPTDKDLSLNELVPSYIPNDFKEIDKTKTDNEMFLTYENNSGGLIFYDVSKLMDMNMNIDTEGAIVEEIYIKGYKAEYILKKNSHSLIWNDGDFIYNISVDFLGERNEVDSKNELIKIAESIR